MPLVQVTRSNVALLLLVACAATPLMAPCFYACFRLLFGTLYPAYASYKAVKTKNVKEYVKWMMYWIVFAFFTCTETITDMLLAFWFPFYYEIKIILVVWLLSPATKGSSILYRKFVHPQLNKREQEIDEYINRCKEQGYHTVLQLGIGGFNFASQFLMQTAMRGGTNIVDQLRRSYSLSDLAMNPDGAPATRPQRALTMSEGDADRTEVDGLLMARDSMDVDDSETDTGDGPTQSSGYGSADAVVAGTKGAKEARPRTRASTKAGVTKKKATDQEVAYNTLPRTTKRATRRKTASPSP